MIELRTPRRTTPACINDVFSYQKEIEFEGELHNCVLVVQNFLGVDREQAVLVVQRPDDLADAAVRAHRRRASCRSLADAFELDDEDRETLAGWVTMLQDWMAGILDWHRLSRRYDEQTLRRPPLAHAAGAVAGAFAQGPTGLGTSAARLPARY